MKKSLIALAVFSTAFQACQSLRPSLNAKKQDSSSLESPLKNRTLAFETVEVETSEPKVVHFENGSSIKIPKDAFVDANGQTITGKVMLSFRQFNDTFNVANIDISMDYKGARGKRQQLESTDMFELKGEADGQAVFIAPNKKIQTHIVSLTPGVNDFYYLEPKVKKGNNKSYNWKKLTNNIGNVPATVLKGVDSFQLKFNVAEYQELGVFKDIQWQLSQKDTSWNPKTAANNWVLEEAWSRVEITQPKFKIKEIKTLFEINKRQYEDVIISPDSLKFIVYDAPTVTLYDSVGQVIAEIDSVDSNFETIKYLSKDLILIQKESKDYFLYDGNLNFLRHLKHIYDPRYYPTKDRLVYSEWRSHDSSIVIFLDKKAQFINEKKYPRNVLQGEVGRFYLGVSSDISQLMIIHNSDTIDFVDFDGNSLSSLEKKEHQKRFYCNLSYSSNKYYQYNNPIVVVRKDGNLDAWDIKTNKIVSSIGINMHKGEENKKCSGCYPNHKSLPYVLFQEHELDKFKLWDYQKNTIKQLDFDDYNRFSDEGNFIIGFRKEERNSSVWDLKGKKIIDFKGGRLTDGHLPITFSKNEEHILILTEEVKLYDNKGMLLRDFKKYDERINVALFYDDTKVVVTHTSNGLVTWWDLEGNIIREVTIDEPCFSLYNWNSLDSMMESYSLGYIRTWNLSGELVQDYGRSYILHEQKKYNYTLTKRNYNERYNSETYSNAKLVNDTIPMADSNEYQLVLMNKAKEYRTYIYLDDKTKELLAAYTIKKLERIQKDDYIYPGENKPIRRFVIDHLGIYNWGKLLTK